MLGHFDIEIDIKIIVMVNECPDTIILLTSRDPGVSDSECDNLRGVEDADTVLAVSAVSSKVTQPLPLTLAPCTLSESPIVRMSLYTAPVLASY